MDGRGTGERRREGRCVGGGGGRECRERVKEEERRQKKSGRSVAAFN